MLLLLLLLLILDDSIDISITISINLFIWLFIIIWIVLLFFMNIIFKMFILLCEFFIFFKLLLSWMIKLAIFTFSTESRFSKELTWFFCLLLMHKWTILFYTSSFCIISAYFPSILSFHLIINNNICYYYKLNNIWFYN